MGALALASAFAGGHTTEAVASEAACGVAKSSLWMIHCFDKYKTASLAERNAPDILLCSEEL